MGVYQGGIRSRLKRMSKGIDSSHTRSLAFWKFYRAYLDNKKPNLIWYTQIFMVASLLNFVFLAIPDRSNAHLARQASIDARSFFSRAVQMGQIPLIVSESKSALTIVPRPVPSLFPFVATERLILYFNKKFSKIIRTLESIGSQGRGGHAKNRR